MSETLYRKYRPTSFAEVVGQEQVVLPLRAALKEKSVGHAYLFVGSRGLGKTSIARILAKELGTAPEDLYEIDAASHTGIDDIRALTEQVYTLPFRSPHKVYIIDEAHMLSKAAWNAFLKTLEEPPAHAIFILATTELAKVPETVQSRCQVFTFLRPTRRDLAALMKAAAKKEGVELSEDAADLVAHLADGSYRDAYTVLQTALTGAGKKVSREDVAAVTGAPRRELVEGIVEGLASGKTDEALAKVREAEGQGVEMPFLFELVLELVRAALLLRYDPSARESLTEAVGASFPKVEAWAKGEGLSLLTLEALLASKREFRATDMAALPLELAVMRASLRR